MTQPAILPKCKTMLRGGLGLVGVTTTKPFHKLNLLTNLTCVSTLNYGEMWQHQMGTKQKYGTIWDKQCSS